MIKIGLDAMGGDFAPKVAVEGAIAAAQKMAPDSKIVIYGDQEQILSIIKQNGVEPSMFEIVPTTEVIDMGDHPARAFQHKPNSSIAVGFADLAAKKIDGFASAGSTGAMMVGSMFVVKPINGILRPTISAVIPTVKGTPVMLLDVGLNVDCRPEVLEQYAIIGSIFCKKVLNIDSPRVALLNIGEEEAKGNSQAKETHILMKQYANVDGYNFVGNIEASHIFTGKVADVVVCDGFVGNTILKLTEGFYGINSYMGIKNSFWEGVNYESIGGTPVLGVNAPIIIGHGKSTAKAICSMILMTELTIKSNIIEALKTAFQH